MPFLYPHLPDLSQRLETSPAHTTVTLGQTLRYAATDFAHVPSAGDGSRQHHAQHRAPPSHPACSMGCPCLHPPAHPGPHFAESPPALEPKSPTTHISQHPLRLPPAQEYPPLQIHPHSLLQLFTSNKPGNELPLSTRPSFLAASCSLWLHVWPTSHPGTALLQPGEQDVHQLHAPCKPGRENTAGDSLFPISSHQAGALNY